jgi:hypothetical protein
MTELLWPAAALLMIVVTSLAALSGWRGWLALQRERLEAERDAHGREPDTATRIEMAAIRERLRKLEAIATGVEF